MNSKKLLKKFMRLVEDDPLSRREAVNAAINLILRCAYKDTEGTFHKPRFLSCCDQITQKMNEVAPTFYEEIGKQNESNN